MVKENLILNMGWGRVIFANTFKKASKVAKTLCYEKPNKRDIAIYSENPHVIISLAPDEIFLNPSNLMRLDLKSYVPKKISKTFTISRIKNKFDAKEINRIYAVRNMIQTNEEYILKKKNSKTIILLVAKDKKGKVIGTVTGVDHKFAINENGSSVWALYVDPQSEHPGIGLALVENLLSYFKKLGRTYADLSVMHDNKQAIALYKKTGFKRLHKFTLKHKNPINEPLYISPEKKKVLTPDVEIIAKEARLRGISIDVLDLDYYKLCFGGKTVMCKGSLTDLTNSISSSRCKNIMATNSLLKKANINVPEQIKVTSTKENQNFLKKQKRIVVRPAISNKSKGTYVDINNNEELTKAIQNARRVSATVLMEQYIKGEQIRVLVMGYKFIAAAIQKTPTVTGTGKDSIKKLISKINRRRKAASQSLIPIDDETKRVIENCGYNYDSVLSKGKSLKVRESVKPGGTVIDVTTEIHSKVRNAAIKAAKMINIPIIGFDIILPKTESKDYIIIKANAQPLLINHEPQPVAKHFIDLLFPQTS
jgi:GNAT-family acetyltransferase (TIGR03103 family)